MAIELPDGEFIELPLRLSRELARNWADGYVDRITKHGLSEKEREFVWYGLRRGSPVPEHMNLLANRGDVNRWLLIISPPHGSA